MAVKSPVIFKLKYYSPTNKNKARNVAHINYIANRPGVALEEPNLEEEEFSLESANIHVKYMGERPRSHGLFGPEEHILDPRAVQKELKNHQGYVWRAIVSLREEDAVRLGYTGREAWEKMLRTSVEEAAGKMGIKPTNLRWVAAFHQEKGHPHVHMVLWEKSPEKLRWTKEQAKQELIAMKKTFVKELYADERAKLLREKTALREYMRSQTKLNVQEARLKYKSLRKDFKKLRLEIKSLEGKEPGVAPVLKVSIPPELKGLVTDAYSELAYKINCLAAIMPKRGRVALRFMPEHVKQEARAVADWILKQPEFKGQVERIQEIAAEYKKQYTIKDTALTEAKEKAYAEIRDRVAQIVLKGAAAINKEERLENDIIRGVWNSAWRAVEKECSRAQAEMQLAQQKEALREKAKQKAREQGYAENEKE
ncbi:MobP3 family relaxase [Zhaonella formicivorans]|uniref:MobP3 family relaxase n=1 Tax=Zhaonella formicivorans TaxID=2528593 RepID=UPI001D115A85|nr:MobP3 family relaxase [Zhaonella formicivorans]